MNMTVSVNQNSGVPYTEIGTNRQKNKARDFAGADNMEVTRLASEITSRKTNDKKAARRMAKAILAIPFVGAAAAMVIKKGKPSVKALAGLKTFAKQAGLIATPLVVLKANDKASKNSWKLQHAEKRHPLATMGAAVAATFGILAGATAIAKKVPAKTIEHVKTLATKIKLDKVAVLMDKAPEAAKTAAKKIASKVSLPKSVSENLDKIASKVKVPEFATKAFSKIAESPITKTLVSKTKGFAGKVLRNAPEAMAIGIATAFAGHSIKDAVVMNHTKKDIKNAQLKTANELVNAYATENESLKSANADLADKVEKGKTEIANESAKSDKAEETDKADEA